VDTAANGQTLSDRQPTGLRQTGLFAALRGPRTDRPSRYRGSRSSARGL